MKENNLNSDSIGRKIGILLLMLLLFTAVGIFLAAPWLSKKRLGGDLSGQFNPAINGQADLYAVTNPAGVQTAWESRNSAHLPNSFLINNINDAAYGSLNELFGHGPNSDWVANNFNVATFQFKETSVKRVTVNSALTDSFSSLFVLTELGEHLFFDFNSESGKIDIFTPPIPVWPASLSPEPLRSQSSFAHTQLSYSVELNVETVASPPAAWGAYAPCILVTNRLDRDDPADSARLKQLFCTDIGLVSEDRFDSNDQLIETLTLVSSNTIDLATNPIQSWTPVTLPAPSHQPTADLANWKLSRVEQLPIITEAAQPSQPLTIIPTDPPLLISSRTAGAATAINANTGQIEWSFATQNTLYGTPAFNEQNGLIYFGSSDKKLYALSPTGVFLDSFSTQDSIVSRPVFAAGTIWFSSEDGYIYCLSADLDPTSARRLELGSPIASSPALWRNMAIFGDDNGTIAAVDADCTLQWEYNAGNPIDSPLIIDDTGLLYFASHSLIGALDPADGTEIWAVEPPETVNHAPALTDEFLYLTDVFNGLHAFRKNDGKLLWSKADFAYLTTPLVIDNRLLINVGDGAIHLLGSDGELEKVWTLSSAQIDGDNHASHPLFTPVQAAGSIWLIDTAGVIYRLGEEG